MKESIFELIKYYNIFFTDEMKESIFELIKYYNIFGTSIMTSNKQIHHDKATGNFTKSMNKKQE